MRVETISTMTVESRLRSRSSYVISADVQYDSPVMAAKIIVNLFRKSIADRRVLTQNLRIRFTMPGASCLALSTMARTIRTTQTINPEKHIVPEDGPKAFLRVFNRRSWAGTKYSELLCSIVHYTHKKNKFNRIRCKWYQKSFGIAT